MADSLTARAQHDLLAKRDQLLEVLASLKSCAVAFSAGVDSTVVAKAAQLALGDRAVAVTADSPSLPAGELEEARRLAALIDIRHVVIQTGEIENPDYVQNAPDRCYHCKTELYKQVAGLTERLGVSVIVNGANADDAGDYRPGMTAAAEHQVKSPLLACGIGKDEVRALAEMWELPVADKPASPCLSSRLAYGEEVTPERLEMIDQAEQFLRQHGLSTVRVRYHRGDLARIEAPPADLERLCRPLTRAAITERLRSLGFRFVALDLEGFRSGSLNQLLQPDQIKVAQP